MLDTIVEAEVQWFQHVSGHIQHVSADAEQRMQPHSINASIGFDLFLSSPFNQLFKASSSETPFVIIMQMEVFHIILLCCK